MFPELSLHILDLVQNSLRAHATLIQISVIESFRDATLNITIQDNGIGMTKEQLSHATNPFFTTRTTRHVGLGIPFFQQCALQTGGTFHLTSEKNVGTTIGARFLTSHIDCIPLGDMNSTIHTLILANEGIDFLYTYSNDESFFSLDTRQLRLILDNIPFTNPEVSNFIKKCLQQKRNLIYSTV